MTIKIKKHHLIPVLTVLAIGVIVGVGAEALGGSKSTALASVPNGGCVSLAVGGIPQAKLEASYRKLTLLGAKTPLIASQPRRYGKCGATHYAFELLTVSPKAKLTPPQRLAQQNHAPVWHESSSGAWVDPPLASLCKLAPKALIKIWAVGVKC
jgi:hypothetical protein